MEVPREVRTEAIEPHLREFINAVDLSFSKRISIGNGGIEDSKRISLGNGGIEGGDVLIGGGTGSWQGERKK